MSLDFVLWPFFFQKFVRMTFTIQVGYDYKIHMEIQIKRNGHTINMALVNPMYTFSFVTSAIYLLPPGMQAARGLRGEGKERPEGEGEE